MLWRRLALRTYVARRVSYGPDSAYTCSVWPTLDGRWGWWAKHDGKMLTYGVERRRGKATRRAERACWDHLDEQQAALRAKADRAAAFWHPWL